MIQIDGLRETFFFFMSIFSLSGLIYLIALINAIRFSVKWMKLLVFVGLAILFYEFFYYWTGGEKLDFLSTVIFSWLVSTISLYYLIDKIHPKIILKLQINSPGFKRIIRFIISNLIFLFLILLITLVIKLI